MFLPGTTVPILLTHRKKENFVPSPSPIPRPPRRLNVLGLVPRLACLPACLSAALRHFFSHIKTRPPSLSLPTPSNFGSGPAGHSGASHLTPWRIDLPNSVCALLGDPSSLALRSRGRQRGRIKPRTGGWY